MNKKLIKDQYDSVIFQNLALANLLNALYDSDLVNTKYYQNLNMNPQLKESLKEVGLNNFSTLLLILFLLLNATKEIKAKGENIDLKHIKDFLNNKKRNPWCEDSNIEVRNDYFRYIRNAVSHMNIELIKLDGMDAVEFGSEMYVGDDKYNIKFSMLTKDVGELMDMLFKSIAEYLNKKYYSND